MNFGDVRRVLGHLPVLTLGFLTAIAFGCATPPGKSPSDNAVVIAELEEVSKAPKDFDYDYCLAVFKFKVLSGGSLQKPGDVLFVACPIIKDGKDTPARSLQPGVKCQFEIDDFDAHYDPNAVSYVNDVGADEADFKFASVLSPLR